MKKYDLKSSGFTLVETLIAIAVLMVAIAGPLTVANQALTSALGSRNAMIATYLAQDGMESIKNIKDNAPTGFSWGSTAGINTSCISSAPCSISHPFSYIPTDLNTNAPCASVSNSYSCRLFTNDTNSDYFYGGITGTDKATPFIRYYYVSGSGITGGQELIVTVVVDWTDGSIPNQIRLQELMTNIKR